MADTTFAAQQISSQRERILLFDSQAEFQADGSMTVTETIRFSVHGINIKRGIIRELPLTWTRSDGKHFLVAYNVSGVQRNGKPEPYSVSRSKRFFDIRIGDASMLLPPGKHEYRITYTVSNHFSRFPEWDELYWNVTGNGWAFPIDSVRFSLRFAPGIAMGRAISSNLEGSAAPRRHSGRFPAPWESIDVYTGSVGERGKKAKILANGNVVTTMGLRKGEGLTVAYTWPRSLLAEAPDPVEDHPVLRALLPSPAEPVTFVYWLPTVLVALYYVCAWSRLRPKGAKTTVIPLFHPPDNLTPGRLRYVLKKEYDNTSFAADLLNIISKGGMRIERPEPVVQERRSLFAFLFRKETLLLHKSRESELNQEEQHTLGQLFGVNDTFDINKKDQKAAQKTFVYRSDKVTEEEKTLFTALNGKWVKGLFLFGLFPVIGSVFFSVELAFVSSIMLFIALLFGGELCSFTVVFIKSIKRPWDILFGLPVLARIGLFWVAFGMSFYLFGPFFRKIPLPDGYLGAIAVFALFAVVARFTAPMHTAEGLKRKTQALGLRLYLGTAERRRFEVLYPPEESVEHFERLLPYALALGVGKTWANRFDKYLEQTGQHSEQFAAMDSWRTIRGFSTASARASSFKSSNGSGGFSRGSSGSGGRGSSGGGSGGGGGGGW